MLTILFDMYGNETLKTVTATDDDVHHLISGGHTQSSETSTVSTATADVNDRLSVFVTLRTVCYSIVFIVGIAGNLLVLTLIINLRSRKQVVLVLYCSSSVCKQVLRLCHMSRDMMVSRLTTCANFQSYCMTSAFPAPI